MNVFYGGRFGELNKPHSTHKHRRFDSGVATERWEAAWCQITV